MIGRSLTTSSNFSNSFFLATKAVEKTNLPPSGKIFLIATSTLSPSKKASNNSSSSAKPTVSFLDK